MEHFEKFYADNTALSPDQMRVRVAKSSNTCLSGLKLLYTLSNSESYTAEEFGYVQIFRRINGSLNCCLMNWHPDSLESMGD